MDAVRAVRPRKPWLPGSSWSYASTSTIRPPTPSTSSVVPIRSGATSWTLRAKKLRLSMRLRRVVTDECRERETEQPAADHAGDPAGRDRDGEVRRARERAGLEVPDRRCSGDLHELDPGDATEHLARRDPIEHHRAQDGADLVTETCDAEQEEGHPELVGECKAGDRRTPERCGDDDAQPLAADVAERAGEQRDDECSRGRRHVEVADERGVVEAVARDRREQRRRHPEDHRDGVHEEEAEDHRLAAHVAEAGCDRAEARPLRILARDQSWQ